MKAGRGPMDRRFGRLQKTLAAVVGLALGALGTAVLAMLWGVGSWVLLLPPLLGLLVGLLFADRGIQLLARVLSWM